MRYLPLSDTDRGEMLARIGVDHVDELFADVPKNLLLKVEYVNQKYSGFAEGQIVNNNIQAWRDPQFSGVISEVSFSF